MANSTTDPPYSVYAYLSTIQKPGAVTRSLRCSWTDANEFNLVVAKGNQLDIHTLSPDEQCADLGPSVTVNIFGRIQDMFAYRPSAFGKDLLFVMTERKKFCVLTWDPVSKRVVTHCCGDLASRLGRDLDVGQRAFVDPQSRAIGVYLYEGHLKVLLIQPSGTLSEPFDLRLPDVMRLIDITLIIPVAATATSTATAAAAMAAATSGNKLTLCILQEDSIGARHMRTLTLDPRSKELTAGPWVYSNLDPGANLIIPIPAVPVGGALILGENTISYVGSPGDSALSVVAPAQITAYAMVDPDGSRFVVSDVTGSLWVLVLIREGPVFKSMHIDRVGRSTIASTLTYLSDGVFFVGSNYADSVLLKLHPQSVNGSCCQVLDSYENLGPILDMTMVVSPLGMSKLITCSGAYHEGSLRIVRHGIGIRSHCELEQEGIKNLFNLKGSLLGTYCKYLVTIFTGETRVLSVAGEEVEEIEIPGFETEKESLFCANLVGNFLLQVTSGGARVVHNETLELVSTYHPTSETGAPLVVTAAGGSEDQLLLACGGLLLYLEVDVAGRQFVLKSQTKLDQDVACMSLWGSKEAVSSGAPSSSDTKVTGSAWFYKTASSKLVAVGMWTDNSVRMLELPSLREVAVVSLGTETQARDILLVSFDGVNSWLLVGLGDGTLLVYVIDTKNCTTSTVVKSRRKVTLGTRPISLSTFANEANLCVFATGDRPTVIHVQKGKLVLSSVNGGEVTRLTQLHMESHPESLAFASAKGLVIGNLENLHRIHTTKASLSGYAPHRIAYIHPCQAIVVLAERAAAAGSDPAPSVAQSGCILFCRDDTDEGLHAALNQSMFVFSLDRMEQALSVMSCVLEGGDATFVVVGTAFMTPGDDEPKRGRLLVFSVALEDSDVKAPLSVNLVASRELKGPVHALCNLQGKIVCACDGLDSKIQLYRFERVGEPGAALSRFELKYECGFAGHIMALYLRSVGENRVLTGDLLRSMTLLEYNESTSRFEEVCRDFSTNYMKALEVMPADQGGALMGGVGHIRSSGGDLNTESQMMGVIGTERLPEPPSVFLGADESGNVFILTDQPPDVAEDERGRMVPKGEAGVGSYINCFTPGSLSSQNRERHFELDADGVGVGRLGTACLFGTVDGAIGTVMQLPYDSYRLFYALERAIINTVYPVGGLIHEEYRAFNNERRYQPKRNIIDGDVCEIFVEIAASKVLAVEGRPIEGAAKNPNHARITLAEQIVRLVNEELSMQAARSHQLGNSGIPETHMTNSSHTGSISVLFGRGNKYIQYTVESLLQIVEDMQSMH